MEVARPAMVIHSWFGFYRILIVVASFGVMNILQVIVNSM